MSYQNTSLVSDIEEDPYYNQNIPHLHHLDYPQNNSVSTFATCCPDYMLCCCKVFSTFTSLCLFSILVLNSIATLVTISIEQFWTYPSRSILNLYSLSFNFIAFLCEMELTESIRNMQMLQSWTLRGFFYVFVSLFSIQETNINEGSYFRAVNSLSTISVLFCGILYIILGMLCLKKVRDKKMAKYIQLLAQWEVMIINHNFVTLIMLDILTIVNIDTCIYFRFSRPYPISPDTMDIE